MASEDGKCKASTQRLGGCVVGGGLFLDSADCRRSKGLSDDEKIWRNYFYFPCLIGFLLVVVIQFL